MHTPVRSVGDDVSWYRSGPKFFVIGTITGENKGIAWLASCKMNKILTSTPV